MPNKLSIMLYGVIVMKTADALDAAVRADEIYQQMLHDYQRAEEEFLRIRNSLSDADKEILEKYISLGEEMDHRRVILALSL